MRFIGIDLGSSFVKGALLDVDALAVETAERLESPPAVTGLPPFFRELEPGRIVEAARAVLERLHAAAPDAAGILVSSQLHGVVLCDSAGRPCGSSPGRISGRGSRPPGSSRPCAEEIEELVGPADRLRLGNERVTGHPVNALHWLARHGLLPARAVPLPLPSFLVSAVCGGEPVCDVTQGCGLGALDVFTLSWHRPVIERLGLAGLAWPRIVPQGAVVAEWRHGGRSLPVHAPVGDYHAAHAGALLAAGELSVNVSTGSAVARVTDAAADGDFQIRPWFDGRYLATVTHMPAGRSVAALVGLLGELAAAEGVTLRDPWATLLDRAERAADAGGLEVDPAFYSGSMGDRGRIANLREENMTVGHLFRAVFTGMADNYARAAARVAPARDWRAVVFSGGLAAKAPLLRRLVLERLGPAHRLAPVAEDALFGLLVLARGLTRHGGSVTAAIAAMRDRLGIG